MSDKKYVVPDGMFKSATDSWGLESDAMRKCTKIILEAALRWQSENPKMPTSEQLQEMVESDRLSTIAYLCAEWVSRMYLAPEPEVPEEIKDLKEIKDLLWPNTPSCSPSIVDASTINTLVFEAFRRGQKASLK